jgi:transposase
MKPSSESPVFEFKEPERVDRIPLVLTRLLQMGVPRIIDTHFTPHGNHQGLSVGWLAVIFLTYILAVENHQMAPVQQWVAAHQHTLEQLTGQAIGSNDFTDDRLADVLRYLSADELWWAIERDLSQHCIRVYRLPADGPVRLDATVGKVYHDEEQHTLFKTGRNKAGGYDVQFKLMLGVLDPLGLPLASDVVAGQRADDPLYVPIYRRLRQTLDRVGLLYIGDCKMGALDTRAVIVAGQDCYLMPLALTGQTPAFLAEQLAQIAAGEVELTPIYLPEDLPTDPDQEPDPELALADGFVVTRTQEATLADGTTVTWEERALLVRSRAYAAMQEQRLEQRLAQLETQLQALTPAPGRGKRQFREEAPLRQAVDQLLQSSGLAECIAVTLERQVTTRPVRAYRGRPARTVETVRYQVHVTRQETAIAQAKRQLAWRVYATNAPAAQLSLPHAVLAYRGQYLAERPFARLKGALLALLPLYVQRDDHAKGLICLLTVALRALVILEFVVRRSLAENDETLPGLYAGNPKRRTARPSAELLLRAFDQLTLTTLRQTGHIVQQQLTPLNAVQVRILELLGLSPAIYRGLVAQPAVQRRSRGAVRPRYALAA